MSEKNYVVNVKTAKGTIVTARGDSAEELAHNIGALSGVHEAILGLEAALTGGHATAVQQVASTMGATVISETPVEQAPSFAPVPPPTAPAGVGGKSCQHGPMVKRTGVGAKGEWRAFFCPTPKGTEGQCSPAFAQRNSAEWNSF